MGPHTSTTAQQSQFVSTRPGKFVRPAQNYRNLCLAVPGSCLPLQGFAATRHITIKGTAAEPCSVGADAGITSDATSSKTTQASATPVPVTADDDTAAASALQGDSSVKSSGGDVAPSTPSESAAATPAVIAAGEQSAVAGSGPDPASVGGAAEAKQTQQGRKANQAGGTAAAVGAQGRGQPNGRGAGGASAGRSRNGSQLSLADQLYAWCREVGLRDVTHVISVGNASDRREGACLQLKSEQTRPMLSSPGVQCLGMLTGCVAVSVMGIGGHEHEWTNEDCICINQCGKTKCQVVIPNTWDAVSEQAV